MEPSLHSIKITDSGSLLQFKCLVFMTTNESLAISIPLSYIYTILDTTGTNFCNGLRTAPRDTRISLSLSLSLSYFQSIRIQVVPDDIVLKRGFPCACPLLIAHHHAVHIPCLNQFSAFFRQVPSFPFNFAIIQWLSRVF